MVTAFQYRLSLLSKWNALIMSACEHSTSIPNLWYSTEEGLFFLQRFRPLTTFCPSSLHSLQALSARIVYCYMTSDALVKTDFQTPASYK